MSVTVGVPTDSSGVWDDSKGYFHPPGTPDGFTLRTCAPGETAHCEAMMEKWEAGSAEPPHSHPGDDMTVVIEGKMEIQFFHADMKPDGPPVTLVAGQSGLIKANRLHDAKYLEACKLVYVHDGPFGFDEPK